MGDCTLMEIRKHVINTKNVIRGGDRLGIYFMETGDFSRGSKVVYDRAYSSISEIQPNMLDWKKILEGVNWFHWTGITPNINYFKKNGLKVPEDIAVIGFSNWKVSALISPSLKSVEQNGVKMGKK